MTVDGFVAPGFEAVRVAFSENFESRRDLGAACAVFVKGEPVVDLWGGVKDAVTRDPWERTTRVIAFSCSKGVLAVCVSVLVDGGLIDLDAPVATYWPEFAAAGKESVTVRQVMSHTAGLLYPEVALRREQVLGWDSVVDWLAAATPMWEPGTAFDYHAHTYGWLVGEIIARVTGKRPAAFLADEIAGPLGLRLSYGVGDGELDALARLEPPLPSEDAAAYDAYLTMVETHPHMAKSSTMNGALPFPGIGGDETYNMADVLRAELPAANLVTDARDLAALYSAVIGHAGAPPMVSDRVIRDMTRWQVGGHELSASVPAALRWGTGFMLDSPPVRPMLGAGSFGHDGAGGTVGFANTHDGVGFAYVTNQMGGFPDDRANVLCRALADVLHR